MTCCCDAMQCRAGLAPGGLQDDEEGHLRGEGPADEPAHVGGNVGREGARAGDPQAEAALDGEAAVQPHLSEGALYFLTEGCFFLFYVCTHVRCMYNIYVCAVSFFFSIFLLPCLVWFLRSR